MVKKTIDLSNLYEAKMSKKLKKIDQEIDSINQINLTNKIVEELLSKADPKELFGRDGLFDFVVLNN